MVIPTLGVIHSTVRSAFTDAGKGLADVSGALMDSVEGSLAEVRRGPFFSPDLTESKK
jgi:hypothetical protein